MLSLAFPATEAIHRADRFDDLFEQLYPRLYGLAYRLVGEQGEAEDVLQEVFLKLIDSSVLMRPETRWRPGCGESACTWG